MIPILLFAIGTKFVFVALWPFGPYQLSLVMAHRLHRFLPAPDFARISEKPRDNTLAICLCAYNEGAVSSDKIEGSSRLPEGTGHLGLCQSGSRWHGLDPRGYRGRIRPVVESDRRGKNPRVESPRRTDWNPDRQFTDANVRIEPTDVAVLRCYFADPSVGCLCSNLRYVNASQSATAFVGSAYWSFNGWSKGLETATGSVIGEDGSLFAIRRRLHRPVPNDLIDDIFVWLATLLTGYRVVRAEELRSFETHTTEATDEFRRKARIARQSIHVHFELWPQPRWLDLWNLYKYINHCLLRRISGCVLVAALLSFFTVASVPVLGPVIVFAVSGSFRLLFFAAWWARLGLAMTLLNVLLALAWNVVAAFQGQRPRPIIWEPPTSPRELGIGGKRATR